MYTYLSRAMSDSEPLPSTCADCTRRMAAWMPRTMVAEAWPVGVLPFLPFPPIGWRTCVREGGEKEGVKEGTCTTHTTCTTLTPCTTHTI